MKVIGTAEIQGPNGPDIGTLWSFISAAVRKEVRIDPDAYRPFAGDWNGTPSGNWDEVAAACELVNIMHGFPTLSPPAKVLGWLRAKLSDKRFMTSEFGSWIYLNFHVEPTVVQLAVCRYMAAIHTDPWAELANGLEEWMRALCGWLTVTGCWGGGRVWDGKMASSGPGARLLTGSGAMSPRHGGALYSVLAGKRSWHYAGHWTANNFAPIFLSWFALRERRTGGDILPLQVCEAIRSSLGYDLNVLTEAEASRCAAAIRNDLDALEWALRELIADWLPAERIVVIRTTRGVAIIVLSAGKHATATVYYSDWWEDGTTHAAGADDGLRGAQGEHVFPGMAHYDIATRAGYCVRVDGEPRPIVPFELPPGDLVVVLEIGGGQPTVEHWFQAGKPRPEEPPPAPGPSPSPPSPRPAEKRRKRSWVPLALIPVAALLIYLTTCR